jgi:hypothetical protein
MGAGLSYLRSSRTRAERGRIEVSGAGFPYLSGRDDIPSVAWVHARGLVADHTTGAPLSGQLGHGAETVTYHLW